MFIVVPSTSLKKIIGQNDILLKYMLPLLKIFTLDYRHKMELFPFHLNEI